MKFKSAAIVFCFLSILSYSQSNEDYKDSVNAFLASNLQDSTKINGLIDASAELLASDLDLALLYANLAKSKAQKAGYYKGVAYAYKYSGIVYYFRSQYVDALKEWKQSYIVFDSINDKQGTANILSNMGAVYFSQGENEKALENFLPSLRISEELGDKLRIATALINIGAVYFDMPATHDLALKNYLQALALAEEINNIRAIGNVSVNLGELYLKEKNDEKALYYYNKGFEAFKGLDGESYALLGIGNVYAFRGDNDRANEYHQLALKVANKNDAIIDAVRALMAMAKTESTVGHYQVSISRYNSALPLAVSLEAQKEVKDIYKGLALSFSNMKRFDSAYYYQNLYSEIKDTIFNLETDKKLNMLRLDYDFEKKENEIVQLTNEKTLKDKIIKRQNIIRNLVIAGFLSVVIFLYIALKQKKRIAKEKQRSEELLLNILPYEVAEELKEKGESDAKNYNEVAVLFTDFKEFTGLSQKLSAKELVGEINFYFKAFDNIISKYGIEKIKTIGDAYMAAGGLPKKDHQASKNVVLAALEMQAFVKETQSDTNNSNAMLFNMRVGIHTGPVVAGIVGVKKFQYDIWGDTVNTASRMESYGEIARVNISEDTYNKLKNEPEFVFEERGITEVKGKGKMKMYFVSLKGGSNNVG